MLKAYKPIFTLTTKIENCIQDVDVLNQGSAFLYKGKVDLYKRTSEENLAYQVARQELENKKNYLVSKHFLQEINGLVIGGNGASFFQEGCGRIISPSGVVIYCSPALFTRDYIHELITWITNVKNCPALVKAAIAHYEFVKIHPFLDGNGRTARLLSTLILHQGGYSLNICFALEDYFEKHKALYYEALDFRNEGGAIEMYTGENDITSWVEYFCFSLLEVMKCRHN